MGSCLGVAKLPENVFKVTAISEDKKLGDKGLMEVTTSELIYTNTGTQQPWRWPLKYLRKYGCDGDVFSFEAGRKCPGGEGLYAFSARHASDIFDTVARNINTGGLEPPAGEQSPFPSESLPVTQNTMIQQDRRTSSLSDTSHVDQPNYANMDITSGKPLAELEQEPVRVTYREVVFDTTPEQHAPPNNDNLTSYSKIDFEETQKYNREKKLGTLSEIPTIPRITSASTSSGSGIPSSRSHKSRCERSRIHTYSGGSPGRSLSDSSFSSQSSLTESSRDVNRPSLGSNGQPSTTGGAGVLYQNIVVSNAGHAHSTSLQQQQQQQYQNVTVLKGTVSDTPTNHTHLSKGGTPRGSSQSVRTKKKVTNGITPVIISSGDSMAQYADLELSNTRHRSTSTPVSKAPPPSLSYSVMEFTRESTTSPNQTSVVPQPSIQSHPRVHSVTSPLPVANGNAKTTSVSSIDYHNETSPTSAALSEKVTYGVLDFPAMHALKKTEHITERDHDAISGSGKKKK